MAFSPSGRLLAVADLGGNTVSMFSVNRATGALRKVRGSPFKTGSAPMSLAFSPSGGLLAVAHPRPRRAGTPPEERVVRATLRSSIPSRPQRALSYGCPRTARAPSSSTLTHMDPGSRNRGSRYTKSKRRFPATGRDHDEGPLGHEVVPISGRTCSSTTIKEGAARLRGSPLFLRHDEFSQLVAEHSRELQAEDRGELAVVPELVVDTDLEAVHSWSPSTR